MGNFVEYFKRKWYNTRNRMGKKRSLYNEIKATQVAVLLLKLSDGEMDYAKGIKLLYGIEREALKRWLRPVIYGDLYSLPYGQVIIEILNLAQPKGQPIKSFWGNYLITQDNTIHLIKECGTEKLSRAEIGLIKEIYEENKDKTSGQLFDEHHDPTLFPEYKDPQGSRIKTTYAELLRVLGKSDKEIEEFEADLDEMAYLEKMAH